MDLDLVFLTAYNDIMNLGDDALNPYSQDSDFYSTWEMGKEAAQEAIKSFLAAAEQL